MNKEEAELVSSLPRPDGQSAWSGQITVKVPSVEHHLRESGGRRACPHPQHRFAQVPDSSARIVLPECAGRERWLAARQQGIGGSDVGALVGVSEYETAFSVWDSKINGGKDIGDRPAIEWGHRLEDVVALKTAEEIGLVSRFGGGLWADREKPHLRVTPDRLATPRRTWKAVGVIECKTAGDGEHWASGSIHPAGQGSGSAPLGYQAQVQWQLGILGLPIGWLGCFVLGSEREFFTVEVHFDKAWFAEMVAEADRIWHDHVLTGEPPMHDLRHRRTEELLKRVSPVVVRPSVDLPEGSEEWLKTYLEAKAEADAADKRLTEAKNFFRMWTGDAGAGYLGEHRVVNYPVVNTSGIDLTKLRAEYPEVAEACTVKSSHRRLTIRAPKGLPL